MTDRGTWKKDFPPKTLKSGPLSCIREMIQERARPERDQAPSAQVLRVYLSSLPVPGLFSGGAVPGAWGPRGLGGGVPARGPGEAKGTPRTPLPPRLLSLSAPRLLPWVTFHWDWGSKKGRAAPKAPPPSGPDSVAHFPRALALFGPVGVASEHCRLWGGANETLGFKAGPSAPREKWFSILGAQWVI